MRTPTIAAAARRGLLASLVVFIVTGALLLVLEGASSVLLVGYDLVADDGVSERAHSAYDPELGWVSRPNVRLPNFYGKGRTFSTNASGFRSARDVSLDVPAGRVRVICSGDSFTMGYGVGDAQTWCHRLQAIDTRLETVNMGMGGYGVDQSYLWYRRDGITLDHDIHVFAFITSDFHRMQSTRFLGYAK